MSAAPGYADGARDALALVSAALSGDEEGIRAVIGGQGDDHGPLLFALVAMVIQVLSGHGTDPAWWVAEAQRAVVRDELRG